MHLSPMHLTPMHLTPMHLTPMHTTRPTSPQVELVLTENDYTLAMWPHKFKAVYTVTLHGEQLRTDFRVINTDDKPFDFTSALHTYIEVLAVDKAKVRGLKVRRLVGA